MLKPERPSRGSGNRADSDKRITILVHKWDPHAFDPEPVRRCVDIWLDAIRKESGAVACVLRR